MFGYIWGHELFPFLAFFVGLSLASVVCALLAVRDCVRERRRTGALAAELRRIEEERSALMAEFRSVKAERDHYLGILYALKDARDRGRSTPSQPSKRAEVVFDEEPTHAADEAPADARDAHLVAVLTGAVSDEVSPVEIERYQATGAEPLEPELPPKRQQRGRSAIGVIKKKKEGG
mgnify:FL=1